MRAKKKIADLKYTVDTVNKRVTLDEWNHIGSLVMDGYGLTITINEELEASLSGTKAGDVYIVTDVPYYSGDAVVTGLEALLAPLPYSQLTNTEGRLKGLSFDGDGEMYFQPED